MSINTLKYIAAGFLALGYTLNAQKNSDTSENSKENDLKTWYHKDFSTTKVYGVNTNNALNFLQNKGLKPKPVIVAVIDGGVEVDHPGLVKSMWKNPNEVPGNGKDDDQNGYIDDVHGWNFIGGKNGDVHHDTLEKTRIVKKYQNIFEGPNSTQNKQNQQKMKSEFEVYVKAKKEVTEESLEAQKNYDFYSSFLKTIPDIVGTLKGKNLTAENVEAIQPTDGIQARNKMILQDLLKDETLVGKSSAEVLKNFTKEFSEGVKHFEEQVKYNYNLNYESRHIVGDDYENLTEKKYGNNSYEGPDGTHGTHVAGIIAGMPHGNEVQYGVAKNLAKIMTIRAVPNGDERDKDVANAIRYAVDNGAKIINMSFGKSFSPNKELVWDAIKYAENKGVLLVHAAGNDNKDLGANENFPTNFKNLEDEIPFVKNYITVGASTNDSDFLRANFSNFNGKKVDVFAPGDKIYSTVPDAKYDYLQGTSMAAPVVSGAAAVLLAYLPTLTPEQVIESFVNTVNKSTVNAMLPTNKNNRFDLISRSGGVIDLKKAAEYAFSKFYIPSAAQKPTPITGGNMKPAPKKLVRKK